MAGAPKKMKWEMVSSSKKPILKRFKKLPFDILDCFSFVQNSFLRESNGGFCWLKRCSLKKKMNAGWLCASQWQCVHCNPITTVNFVRQWHYLITIKGMEIGEVHFLPIFISIVTYLSEYWSKTKKCNLLCSHVIMLPYCPNPFQTLIMFEVYILHSFLVLTYMSQKVCF